MYGDDYSASYITNQSLCHVAVKGNGRLLVENRGVQLLKSKHLAGLSFPAHIPGLLTISGPDCPKLIQPVVDASSTPRSLQSNRWAQDDSSSPRLSAFLL